jgi:Ca2+-binding RTX toxin-like protein
MSTVNTTISHGITLSTPGYYSPLTIATAGTVDNAGTGAAVYGAFGTVINYGNVIASGVGNYGGNPGVYLGNSPAALDNRGTITAAGNAAALDAGGELTNSGILSGGRWGVTSRDLLSVTNTGTIHGGLVGINLFAGGSISNSNQIDGLDGLVISGATGTVDNSGTITGTHGAGINLSPGGSVSNTGTGLITAGGVYAAISIYGGVGTVVNAATLNGYTGIAFAGTYNDTVIDSGTIIGTGGTAIAFGAGNDLLQFQPSAGAFIQGTVDGGDGNNTLELASGATTGTLTGSNAVFTNFRRTNIDNGADWVFAGSVTFASGMYVISYSTPTVAGTLVNGGQFIVNDAAYGVTLAPGGQITNLSSGRIGLRIVNYLGFEPVIRGIAGGPATVANFGTIGPGELGVYLPSGGVITNGAANDTAARIYGHEGIGSGVNSTTTVVNYGTILGNRGFSPSAHNAVDLKGNGVVINAVGAAYLVGGSGVEFNGPAGTVINFGTIRGTDASGIGVDMYSGSHGTVIDGGTIIGSSYAVRFNQAVSANSYGAVGYNLLELYPGADLVGGAYAAGVQNRLELASGSSTGTIAAVGTSYSGFSTITVDTAANWALTGSSTLASGDTLTVDGTLTAAGTLTVSGEVADVGTMINSGQLAAVPDGLLVGHNGYLLNTGSITAAGTANYLQAIVTGGGTLPSTIVNLGTLNAASNIGIALHSGGTVRNGASGASAAEIYGVMGVFSGAGSNATITNYGTIAGGSSLAAGFGVLVQGSGVLTNGAPGATAALISGTGYGALLVGAGGSVVNFGTIAGGFFDGVEIIHGQLLVNAGQISGGVNGVALAAPATVVNVGTISGTLRYGVYLQSGGTVADGGTISGAGGALAFGGNASNLLVLLQGYLLQGNVLGSASASNTVELLGTSSAAAVAATYGNLNLSNFGTIAFASGAPNYATLRITNNTALPGTIAGFVGAHDTIDLTALSDAGNDATTSFDTLSNVLTVTGDNGSVQLQLDSEDYSSVGWLASNDGSGGTDVTVQNEVAPTPPSVTGTKANQGVANETPSTPFATVTEVDPNVGDTPTVTVTLSAPGQGTLSNLSGGSYNAATGVYQVTGSAAADTAALEALVFTPIALPNVAVTTTVFTISPGAGGTADSSTNVTSVQQIVSLADVPANQIVISVSPDGTGFGAAVAGKTNEAVVSDPVLGGSYSVPTGYQALFLGGTSDATLNDGSVGNAILVANSGNDQLFANAANDVLVAGSGNDSLFGGSFASTVVGGAGAATVFAGSGPIRVINGTGPLTFVGGAGRATVTGGAGAETLTAGAGGLVYVAAGAGRATIDSGTGSVTLFGASGAALNLTGNSGNPDYLVAGDGNETLNASASSSSNWLSVSTTVSSAASVAMLGGSGNDTLISGSAPVSTIMTGGNGADAFVFFKQLAGAAQDIVTDFNADDAVFIEGYGAGSAAALQNAAIVGAGGLTLTLSDNTTITFTNLTNAQSLDGRIQYG